MRHEIIEAQGPVQLSDAMDVDYIGIPVLQAVACSTCGSRTWARSLEVTRCFGCKAAVWHQDYSRLEPEDGETIQ